MSCTQGDDHDMDADEPREDVFLTFATTDEIIAELKKRGNNIVLITDRVLSDECGSSEFVTVWHGGLCQALGMVERAKTVILDCMDAEMEDGDELHD